MREILMMEEENEDWKGMCTQEWMHEVNGSMDNGRGIQNMDTNIEIMSEIVGIVRGKCV